MDSEIKLVAEGLSFPESPRWHDGRLFFSDFWTETVFALDGDGRLTPLTQVPQQPGGLGFLPDGTLLVLSRRGRSLNALRGGKLEQVADLSGHVIASLNDMIVDHAGRAYVGNLGFDLASGEPPRSTVLLRVDPDGTVVIACEDVLFPNGAALSADGRTMVLAETFAHRLTAFDVAPNGMLFRRRVFAELPGMRPDGICLDADGAIWVGNAEGDSVLRVLPDGRIDRQIKLGDWGCYACVLGGADRRTLYLCLAKGHGAKMATRRDGAIASIRVASPGVGIP